MKLNVKNDDFVFGSNINTIKVPEKLKEKVATGLGYFDAALGGKGMTPSLVTLFCGTPGAGKTTMMLTLADSLTKSGHIALFNTAEESLYQVKLTVDRLKLKNGFKVGQESHVPTLLNNCKKIIEANPKKNFCLIIDSLQTLDDGKFDSGRITNATAERALQQITDFCKKHYCNALVIGQVTKSGNMAGTQKLKHMVDVMLSLHKEENEKSDFFGCRVLETHKNRFGGAGHSIFLSLKEQGFFEVARVCVS